MFDEPARLGAQAFDRPNDRGCCGDRNEVLGELASRAPTSVRLQPPVQTPAQRDGRPGIGLSRNHHVGNPRLVCFDAGLAYRAGSCIGVAGLAFTLSFAKNQRFSPKNRSQKLSRLREALWQ